METRSSENSKTLKFREQQDIKVYHGKTTQEKHMDPKAVTEQRKHAAKTLVIFLKVACML